MAKIRLRQDKLSSASAKTGEDVPDTVAMALVQAGYAERLGEDGKPIEESSSGDTVKMRLKRSLDAGAILEVKTDAATVLEAAGLAAYASPDDTNAHNLKAKAGGSSPGTPLTAASGAQLDKDGNPIPNQQPATPETTTTVTRTAGGTGNQSATTDAGTRTATPTTTTDRATADRNARRSGSAETRGQGR